MLFHLAKNYTTISYTESSTIQTQQSPLHDHHYPQDLHSTCTISMGYLKLHGSQCQPSDSHGVPTSHPPYPSTGLISKV